MIARRNVLAGLGALALPLPAFAAPRAPGDLGIVIERAGGAALRVDWGAREIVDRIEGLGDLSHASAVFSADQRFAYVFGRDGGLSQIDIMEGRLVNRVVQGGNAIGGAISDDGRLVAVSNYEPGGVRVFDAETLAPVADIPTGSKTIGLVDAPGRRFVFTLWDDGETWIADFSGGDAPDITRIEGIGQNPYDGLITGDGRRYITGLFGEDGLTTIDLWQEPPKPRRIMAGYGRGEEKLPVYKMPHLEGWALAGDRFALPAVGRREILWMDAQSLEEIGRTETHGQPIFAVAEPGGRRIWVNFAHPRNDVVQVIDAPSGEVVHEFRPGPAVLHMEFTPRGHEVWISVRDENRVDIHDVRSFARLASLEARTPSGIFFAARAHRMGL